MITEAEAKTKWCPLARVPLAGGDLTNRNGTRCCIASACMAWRFASGNEFKSMTAHADEYAAAQGYKFDRAEGNTKIYKREPQGYCGAFDKPK